MASNDITSTVSKLLNDLVNRHASQQQGHTSGPPTREWATTTRRETPLPKVSQRSAQILQQIVDMNKSKSGAGNYGSAPVLSRADMIAQRDPQYGGGGMGIGAQGPGQQVLNQQAPPVPPPPIPQYENQNMHIRGVADRPDLQTRQYSAPQPLPPVQTLQSYIMANDYSQPPPTAEIPMEEWAGYTHEQRQDIVAGMLQAENDQSAVGGPSVVPSALPAIQEEAIANQREAVTNPVTSAVSKAVQRGWGALPGQAQDAPAWALEETIDLASWPKEKWDQANADVLVYMANHNGEKPTWANILYGDPGSDSEQAALLNRVSEFGEPTGVPEGQPSLEDVKRMQTTSNYQFNDDQFLADAFMVPYIENHPEYLPTIKRISDEAIAAGLDPTQATLEWFRLQQSGAGKLLDSILNDPLNLALPVGELSKALKAGGDLVAINAALAGEDVPTLAKLLDLGGTVTKVVSAPINDPVEAAFKGIKSGFRRVGQGAFDYGDAATRQVAQEALTGARKTAEELIDPEAAFNRAKATQADADAARARATADRSAMPETLPLESADNVGGPPTDLGESLHPINRTLTPTQRVIQDSEDVIQSARGHLTADSSVNDFFSSAQERKRPLASPHAEQALKDAEPLLDDVAAFDAAHPVQDVPLESKMIATQTDLYPDQIQKYVDDPSRLSEYADGPIEQKVIAVKDGDTYYIVEGHHRVAAAKVRGETSIPMNVIDATPAGTVVDVLPSNPEGMGYLKPGPLKSGEPNLAQQVIDRGADNPAAARAFMDEYEPMASGYIKRDAARKPGDPISMYDDVSNRVRTEELFFKHFGEKSGYYESKGFRKGAVSSEQGAIERSVFGNDAESAAAFDRLVDFSQNPGSKITPKMIDNLSQLRERYTGISGRMTPAPVVSAVEQAPVSSAQSTFDDIMAEFEGIDTVPYTRANRFDDADKLSRDIEQALHGGPGNARVKGSAAQARNRLYKSSDPEVKRMAEDLSKERGRLYGDGGNATTKPPGSMGIVNDPFDSTRDAANATRAAFGQMVPNVTKPAREAGELFVDERLVHGTTLKQAAEEKLVTQRAVDDLQQQYTLPDGSTTSYWDRLNYNLAETQKVPKKFPRDLDEAKKLQAKLRDDYTKAFEKTDEDFASIMEPPQRGKLKRLSAKAMGYQRKWMQFNVVTGPRAIMQDGLTNARIALLTGEGGGLKDVPKITKFLMRDVEDTDMLDLPMFSNIRATGAKIPNDIHTTVGIGREEVERAVSKDASKLGNLNPLDNLFVRKLRGAQDNANRLAAYANYYNRNLIHERRTFLDLTRTKAHNLADDSLLQDIAELGEAFTPADVRRVTLEHGMTDDSLARTWAKQVDDLSQQAGSKQRQMFFSYKKTKIDDAIGKVFLFHYYMTRSSALYLKIMLQHPQLIRMEAELWKASADNLNDLPGTPDWMKGFMGYAQDNGHALYTNPLQLITSTGVFASLGEQGFAKTKLMQMLNATGLFVNPLINAAAAIAGREYLGDVTGTGQLRKAILSVVDEIRNSDWGRKHGYQGVTPDWLLDVENGIVDVINQAARKIKAPFDDFEAADSETVKMNKVREMMNTNFNEEFGPDMSMWSQDEIDRYAAANAAIESDQNNPDVDAALDEYSGMNAQGVALNAISPSGAFVRDAATDARLAEQREAGQVPYNRRTDEQNAIIDQRDIEDLQSPEAINLGMATLQYYDIGSDRQNTENDNWNLIVYGLDDPQKMAEIPDNYTITIDGQQYTAGTIRRMTTQERMDLADSYVADVEVPGGKVAANMEDKGQSTGEFSNFRSQRKAARAANPVLDDFLTYRTWILNADERGQTVREVRAQMMAVPGNTEFKNALSDYQDYAMNTLNLQGEQLEAALDKWMGSEAAYAATQGWQWKSKSGPGSPLFNINNPAPWHEEEESAPTEAEPSAAPATEEPLDAYARRDADRLREDTHHWGTKYEWEDWKDRQYGNRFTRNPGQSSGLVEQYLRR